ncbi:hypothetical protein BC829DRAFT_408332 [Chytridium lagenaria]|nr:hypothetical protein BC829DRAFT_408332 [Chytridium lagenaria]
MAEVRIQGLKVSKGTYTMLLHHASKIRWLQRITLSPLFKPPIKPDERLFEELVRCCSTTGDLAMAIQLMKDMVRSHKLRPNDATLSRVLTMALPQGLPLVDDGAPRELLRFLMMNNVELSHAHLDYVFSMYRKSPKCVDEELMGILSSLSSKDDLRRDKLCNQLRPLVEIKQVVGVKSDFPNKFF